MSIILEFVTTIFSHVNLRPPALICKLPSPAPPKRTAPPTIMRGALNKAKKNGLLPVGALLAGDVELAVDVLGGVFDDDGAAG